jgi:hypothetical protein
MTATLTDRPADTLDRKPPLACCPNWNHEELVPLIPTFVFPQYEFYCLECGRNVAFMGPRAGESTPELEARYLWPVLRAARCREPARHARDA